ncbi:hypothetical protein B0H10DRAFT_2213711 [Mycena sp. CBHHK59/15]|nr:hypothetical protein B0H10DRAFT_2213711 [Mycena sp. CBHHK59/15]
MRHRRVHGDGLFTLGARSVGAGRRSRPDVCEVSNYPWSHATTWQTRTWTNFKALRASTPGPAVADPVPTCVLLLLLRDFVNLTVCVSKPDGAGLDIGPPLIDSLAPQKHGWLFGRTSWVRLDWHGPSAAEAWGRRRRSAPSSPRPRTPPAGNGGQLQLSISRSAQLVDPAARAVLKAVQTPDDYNLFYSNLTVTRVRAVNGCRDVHVVPVRHPREALSMLQTWNPAANAMCVACIQYHLRVLLARRGSTLRARDTLLALRIPHDQLVYDRLNAEIVPGLAPPAAARGTFRLWGTWRTRRSPSCCGKDGETAFSMCTLRPSQHWSFADTSHPGDRESHLHASRIPPPPGTAFRDAAAPSGRPSFRHSFSPWMPISLPRYVITPPVGEGEQVIVGETPGGGGAAFHGTELDVRCLNGGSVFDLVSADAAAPSSRPRLRSRFHARRRDRAARGHSPLIMARSRK